MSRVLHIITGLGTGGAEMMLFKLLSRLSRSSTSHTVVSLRGQGTVGPRLAGLGIEVHALDMPRGVPTPSGLWRLNRLVREVRPNVIQGWMYHGNLAATAASAFVGGAIPVVWNVRQTLYSLEGERTLSRLVIRLNAAFSRNPGKIIYNSEISRKQHEAFGFASDRSVYIPNGFDTEVFCPDAGARETVREELGVPPSAPLIGLIARYHPMKDHAVFLQAASILHLRQPGVHFLLAGAGITWANQELAGMVSELRLDQNVHLLGDRADVPRLTAALDIAVSSSSRVEAFSNAIGEAMACGVLCVATDVGDVSVILGGTGTVVPPKDTIALSSALEAAVLLPQQERVRLGQLARQRILGSYDLAVIATQYEAVYGDLLRPAF